MRHIYPFGILMLLLAFSACSKPKERPNIIFIMSDDHAKKALSCYYDELIKTPNLDKLAKEGILFNKSFVTNSICSPSRAVLLTGKYSHINGKRDNSDRFDSSQVTFPKLLQEAGYYTAVIGKWHLKSEPSGFDYWNILPGQGEYYNPEFIEMGKRNKVTGYVTNIITDQVIKTIKERDKSKPFCILYHHKAPHRNWMPDTVHLDSCSDKRIPLPENFYDDFSYRGSAAHEQDMEIKNMFLSMDMKLHPDTYKKSKNTGGRAEFDAEMNWQRQYNSLTPEQKKAWDRYYDRVNQVFKEKNLEGDELAEWMYQRYMTDYLKCVMSIDDNLGRLLRTLKDEGIDNNTLIVYTSDQGFFLGEHGWYDKRFMYEESLSVPLIIRYPNVIKAGKVSDNIVLNLDFAPTLLDFAQVKPQEDMQGESLRPICSGGETDNWRTAMYYHYYEYPHGWHKVKRHYGIRTDKYKLIHFYNDVDEWELYDLEEDIFEMNNIYYNPDNQPIVDSLKKELLLLQKKYKDPISKTN